MLALTDDAMDMLKPVEDSIESANAVLPLLAGCKHTLEQCTELLQIVSLNTYVDASVSESSIGSHVRHFLNRFQCFLYGVARGRVDYDARNRDTRLAENPGAAQLEIDSLLCRLQSWELTNKFDQPLIVVESVDHRSPAVVLNSTVERELMSLVSHSVHHLAIIGMIASAQGLTVDRDLGKAPSTRVFEQSRSSAHP